MKEKIMPYYSNLIDSYFNESIRESWSMINMKGGKYQGWAYCHPDDVPSSFLGCHIAEIRAKIKGLKNIKKQKAEEFRQWNIFVKKCEQYKGFDKESTTARAMYRQLNRKKKEVEEIDKYIEALYNFIDVLTKRYADFQEKRAKKD